MDPASWELYWTFRSADLRFSTEKLANFGTTDTKEQVKNISGHYGDTLLHLACGRGWLGMVKLLIEEYGCDPMMKDCGEQTSLHYACRCGHLDLVEYLSSLPVCDAMAPTRDSWTLLHYACRYGHEKIVEYLTVKLPEMLIGVDQLSLLCLTCKYGHSNIVLYVMEKWGFTPEKIREPFNTKLLLTACQYDDHQVAHYLLKRIVGSRNIKLSPGQVQKLFIYCCKNGRLDVLKQLGRCDLIAVDKFGKLGIQYACQEGHIAVVKHLVEDCSCDINSCDRDGLTPLHLACKHGNNVDVVEYILSRPEYCSVLVQTTDNEGNTALHFACLTNEFNPQILNILVENGATVSKVTLSSMQNLQNYDDSSVKPAILSCLLKAAKWDLNIRNNAGITPVQLATYPFILRELISCHTETDFYGLMACGTEYEALNEIVFQIETLQFDLTQTASNGDTVLHIACAANKVQIANYLLKVYKFDPNITNKAGDTPLTLVLKLHIYKVLPMDKVSNLTSMLMKDHHWKPDLTARYGNGNTLFHLACQANQKELIHEVYERVRDDHSLMYTINDGGYMPLELNLKLIVEYVQKGAFQYTFKPGSVHQFICFFNSISETQIAPLFNSRHYKNIKWKHKETNECCVSSHVLKLPSHPSVCLLINICHHSREDIKLPNQDFIDIVSCENCFIVEIIGFIIEESISNIQELLIVAYIRNNLQFVNHLLQNGVKIQADTISNMIDFMFMNATVSDAIIKLLTTADDWDPNLPCNSYGDTILHLSVWMHTPIVTIFLLSKTNCDPNVKNHDGETFVSLMSTCSDTDCVKILEHLMATTKWDPNSSCNSKGDTALHLFACDGKYESICFLLSKTNCDPNVKNHDGETVNVVSLMLTCSDTDCVKILEHLMATTKWDPNSSCNSKGDTALHLFVCDGKYESVCFLLSETKCDPNAKNLEGKTPLQLAVNTKIINDLIRYGANPENVYKSHGKTVGLSTPLIPPVKVFIVGNSGVGKSTLTASLKREISVFLRVFTGKRVSDVDEKTAGIVPHDFESKLYGKVTFYDFAGHREFYSSHAAILDNVIQRSSPVFLIVVNMSESDDEIKQNTLYWQAFIENHCNNLSCKPKVIIIGSHADIVHTTGQNPAQKATEIFEPIKLNQRNSMLEIVGIYPIDYQYPHSSGMSKVRQCLMECCRSVRIPISINFNVHCFHVFLADKFRTHVAATIQEIELKIRAESATQSRILNFLPETTHALCNVCDELNDRGHILFLKNTDKLENSWVILDKSSLLSELTGTIFAPKNFKEHCQLAESTGVVPLSKLAQYFSKYEADVLVGFLSHLEFCREIIDQDLLELISNHVENSTVTRNSDCERYFLFPGLITQDIPRNVWEPSHYFKYHTGWILQCTQSDQFFSSRFLQVLLLRLAFSFALVKAEVNEDIPALQRECSIWKSGIFWGEMFGMETIVEVTHNNKAVLLLIRSQEENLLHCIAQRSSIIKKILQCSQTFCSHFKMVESFIDPTEATKYPLKFTSELYQFNLQKIAEAVLSSDDYDSLSVVCSKRTIPMDALLSFEPYSEIGASLIKYLYQHQRDCQKISDEFLERFSLKLSRKLKEFIAMFKSSTSKHVSPCSDNLFTELQEWRHKSEGTYKSLKEKLDQFSVFSGRNILELSQLPQVDLEITGDMLPGASVAANGNSHQSPPQYSEVANYSSGDFKEDKAYEAPPFYDLSSVIVHEHCQQEEKGTDLNQLTTTISQSDAFSELNTAPKLHQLQYLEGNGKIVKVIRAVAAMWDHVALSLHFEAHDISRIKMDHHQQSVQAMITVFHEWLEGGGRQPTTWQTLIKALNEAGFLSVASDLENILGNQHQLHHLSQSDGSIPEIKIENTSIEGDKPKLAELHELEGHGGRRIRLVEEVGYEWKALAVELDFDESRIDSIDTAAYNKHEDACHQMFVEWLDGDSDLKQPVTWGTLIQCLIDAGLVDVADRLKEIVYKC